MPIPPSDIRVMAMDLQPLLPYFSPAQGLALTVRSAFHAAMSVAAGRATNPNSFPIVPKDADADFWARRLLADLVEAGITPEGWEEAFFLDFPSPEDA